MHSSRETPWRRVTAFGRRVALIGAAAMLASSAYPVSADTRVTEKNMTQKDYDDLAKTETSVPDEPKEFRPDLVHDLSDANEKELKDANATRVTKGKNWRKMSPKQRDAEIRRLKKLLKPGTILIMSMPKCDIWVIPDQKTYLKLWKGRTFRSWHIYEYFRLPVSVRPSPPISHSDRHGTNSEPPAPEPERP